MLHTRTYTHTHELTHQHTIILLEDLVIFLCFVIIEYKFVLFVRLVLNVHFVRAVLQPLFVSYLHSFISLALFIDLFYPCAYSTLILN